VDDVTVVAINRELLGMVVSELRLYHLLCDLCVAGRKCPTQQRIDRANGLLDRSIP
jgi:hypothetical protein